MTPEERANRKLWIRACINVRAGTRIPSCGARGSQEMVTALRDGLAERDLDWRIETVHCMGKCHIGPTMRILPNGPFIMGVTVDDVPRVLDLLEAGAVGALAEAFPLPPFDDDA